MVPAAPALSMEGIRHAINAPSIPPYSFPLISPASLRMSVLSRRMPAAWAAYPADMLRRSEQPWETIDIRWYSHDR